MPIQVTTATGNKQRTAAATAGTRPIGDTITLQQALDYLNVNVTTLPTAKVYLAEMTKEVLLLRLRVQVLETQVAALTQLVNQIKK